MSRQGMTVPLLRFLLPLLVLAFIAPSTLTLTDYSKTHAKYNINLGTVQANIDIELTFRVVEQVGSTTNYPYSIAVY